MSNIGTQKIDYFNTKAISNSLMSVYIEDYLAFKKYWVDNIPLVKKDTEALKYGSVIDIMLTSEKEFNDKVEIYSGNYPSGQMLKYIKFLLETGSSDIAYGKLEEDNGGKKLRDSKAIFEEKFNSFKDFFELLKNNSKIIISPKEKETFDKKVLELRNNPNVSLLVNITSSDNIQVEHQLEIYTDYKGIPLKGCLDKVIIDHVKKRVLIIDYKTTYNPIGFENSVLEYKYYRQCSYYKFLIKSYLIQNNLTNYFIMEPMILIIAKFNNLHHYYKFSELDMEYSRIGGYTFKGEYLKGWEKILDEIVYLKNSNNWNYPYEIAVNKGIITSNIFKEL